jgi:hypothetical protein
MDLQRVLFADSFAPDPQYQVRLTGRDRGVLRRLVAAGTAPACTLSHARILLKADLDGPGWPDERIAEIELSVLSSKCLDRRLPSRVALVAEVAAWTTDRNAASRSIQWHFTTADARAKLSRLYPPL